MPLTPLRPGDPEVLGEHRLLGRLGQGGMGTVYLGLDGNERAVAVKVLREGPADLQGRERFRRELAALRRARGAHLVEVLGGDVEAEPPWIVTRFVPGRRLDEIVTQDGPLSEPALRRLADGLAEGLFRLHQAGVVHRDLSPGNVLLVDGEPQVIDLGLAVMADVTNHTRTGLLLGTAGYLAPEQVVGDAYDAQVDVHAWGAVVAFAGTGRPPYGLGRSDAILYRVVHEQPDLDGLPWPLRELVAAALAKDPRDRPRPADLGRGIYRLPELVGSGPQHRTPGAKPLGVADLLGPRATEVLGEHATQVLGSAGGSTTDKPQTMLLEAPPTGPELTPAQRRWSTIQAGSLAAASLLLLFAFARWLPLVTSAAALVGLTGLLVAARSHAAWAQRRDRKGPRGSDGLVTVAKLPGHLMLSLLDLLIVLPAGAGVGAALGWLVSDGTPFGRSWLPEQDQVTDVRALAVAVGLVAAVGVALVPGPARGARTLLRRAATAPLPGTAALLVAGFAVLALSVLAYVSGAAPVWVPRNGPILP